jgi:ribosomal protein S12 methylthiotransferase accessory factor
MAIDPAEQVAAGPAGPLERVKSSTALMRYLWQRRAVLGVSRLVYLTPLDRIGVPVAAAIRPKVDRSQITTCQGKGASARAAIVGALMEAAERFSCASFDAVFEAPLNRFDPRAPTNSETVDVVRGVSLRSGEARIVRASSVIFPYRRWREGTARTRPNTSGLAAGTTPRNAIAAALLEVVERDAVSRFLEGEPACAVDLSNAPDPMTRWLLAKFAQHGIELAVANLTGLACAPTYKVFALDAAMKQPHLAVTGQASHPDTHVALRKALLEIAQARAAAIQASREDFGRHQATWDARYSELRDGFDHLRARLRPPTASTTLGGREPEPSASLDRLVAACPEGEAVAVDLTHPELAVPVFRVVVPGLADTFVGHSREDRHVA